MPTLIPASYRAKYPVLFAPDQHIDRHKCTRQRPMQVLALGYARTGTASMRQALDTLGIPTYHFYRLFTSVRDSDMWLEAYDSKFFSGSKPLDRSFWDGLLGHVGAVTDHPCIGFAEELIAAYPEAKVILWERDEDAWFKSIDESLIKPYKSRLGIVLSWLDFDWLGRLAALANRGTEGIYSARTKEDIRKNARLVYRRHHATVRNLLKDQPDRLLEYKMGDGWEPICHFLDLPVPKEPFPHVNEKAYMETQKGAMLLKVLDRLFWKAVAVSIPVMVFMLAMRLNPSEDRGVMRLLSIWRDHASASIIRVLGKS